MLWLAAYVLQSVFDSRQFSIGTGMQCEAPQFVQKSFFEWEWIGFLLPALSYCYTNQYCIRCLHWKINQFCIEGGQGQKSK